MARQNVSTLTDEHTYSSGTETGLDIPETGYISHISCLVKLGVTGNSIVSPKKDASSVLEDAIARIIDAMRITAAGGKNYYDITDGRQGFFKEYYRLEGKTQIGTLPAAGVTADVYLELIIHPGLNPFDPWDRSVIIPGAELSNLKHRLTWGTEANLGSGYTIDSGVCTLTIYEWQLEPGESRDALFPGGINVPLLEARELSITGDYSNLGKTDDVPVGSVLHSVLIMPLDADGDRSDGEITEVGLVYPKKQKATPFRQDWYPMKFGDKAQFSLATALVGCNTLPLEWITRRAMGMDLTAAMEGDVKLGFTVALSNAAATFHILYSSIALG